MLQLSANPILNPAPAVSKNTAAPTIEHARHLQTATRRSFKAKLKLENASRLIEAIPGPGEAIHLICNGNFASWDIVPAILRLTGDTIQRLDIATLGFNRANAAEMAALMDEGRIRELW